MSATINVRWSATEDATIRSAWEQGGVKDAVEWLRHRTADAINKRAAFLGLRRYKSPSSRAYKPPVSVTPANGDYSVFRRNARLRKWRYPVVKSEPRFGVAMIGGGYAQG